MEIELLILKCEDYPQKLSIEIKEQNKIFVNNLKLHQIRDEVLGESNGVFEKIGGIVVCENTEKTNIRFRNIKGFETYIISRDENCWESDDGIFCAIF